MNSSFESAQKKKEISNSETYSRLYSNVKQVKNQEFETNGQCQDDQSDD